MVAVIRALERRLSQLQVIASGHKSLARYADDPCGYCAEVLRVKLTPTQQQIARLLVTPPYKVLVRAGHNVGKSFLAACLVNWWYDCFEPGICLTTAPTDRQVRDILWKEVRVLRGSRGGFAGPKVCRLEDAPNHFAHGFTARDGSRFQGHHSPAVFIVFDEAVGVDPIFWEAAQTMLGGSRFAFLAIYNPTDQGSRAYAEEREPGYHPAVTMSALDHPNIEAELHGKQPPYPSAIRLGRLTEMLEKWTTPLDGEPGPDDISLGSSTFVPGPVAEARLLGRWPRQAVNAVWSQLAFDLAVSALIPDGGLLQIGCDVARYGDDFTAIHVRRGGNSLHHESHNGWSVPQIIARLRDVVGEWASKCKLPAREVPICIDDSGVGGGVTDGGKTLGLRFVGVNASSQAPDPLEYPNLRSALWFGVSEQAAIGNVSFAKLPATVIQDLRAELLAPTYTLDARGRRVVELKDCTKERLKGRSPDNADALNLAYLALSPGIERVAGRVSVPS